MKKSTAYFALIFFAASHSCFAIESLYELRWQNRIILIKAFENLNSIHKEIMQMKAELHERDVIWFVIQKGTVETNLNEQISVNFQRNMLKEYFESNEINVVLIGKDGGVKKTQADLDLNELCELIDTMPMRKLEMAQ